MCENKQWIRGCLFVLLTGFCACSPKGEASAQSETQAVNQAQASLKSLELPLPEVPSDLIVPQERATYILTHFWDGMDFSDTLRTHNRDFMELNFVNFVSLFPHSEAACLPDFVNRLLLATAADAESFALLSDIVEKYLSDAGSPMRNEEYYILFLEGILQMSGLSESTRSHATYQLQTALKNRPGSLATNFSYITREGVQKTLYQTAGNLLLLIFYDPACPHCSEILKGLDESSLLQRLAAEGILSILAIYTEGNRELWDETKADMPSTWCIGMDASDIVDAELYDLPAMPVIYLLDENKNVLLKDPMPEVVENYLRQAL